MKADIQSQIANINQVLVYDDIMDCERDHLERRKTFLKHVLEADYREIDSQAREFVYGK